MNSVASKKVEIETKEIWQLLTLSPFSFVYILSIVY